ncbi:2OG-Fe(II) oxygenase [Pseudanabaena sp. FACHB-1998]|uniref:2OG-Fe(II) oxygenase n=1 Tax=Pseudanabaena sp. FACHB-1998 TaxID=2692858 RepID=UPI001680AEA4|nr:2OG-Fe(II) oxygenase [Pseudanabaena sp. FACHB-1998]MBD2179218.1 2OG-Fe(II) oxygenase [Pseudanabaena sp. FACHB-1998]
MIKISNSLAEILRLIEPAVVPKLITVSNWNTIDRIAQLLPNALSPFFGFEYRLGNTLAEVDFLLCVAAEEAGKKVLGDRNYDISLPSLVTEEPIWQRIQAFAIEWNMSTSAIATDIFNIWLEFDTPNCFVKDQIPLPSFFMGINDVYRCDSLAEQKKRRAWLVEEIFPLLLGKSLMIANQEKLYHCFQALPQGAHVFQIGLMLARQVETVRLCIRNISPLQIGLYLSQIGWKGNIEQLSQFLHLLSPLVDRVDLDIDVDHSTQSKIGLECYLYQQPSLEPRWSDFFNFLEERSLCVPEKREAIFSYPGYLRESANQEKWPEGLKRLTQILGAKNEGMIFRGIHHVKVTYEDDVPQEAKSYLYVARKILNHQEIRQSINNPKNFVEIENFLTESEQEELWQFTKNHHDDFVLSDVYNQKLPVSDRQYHRHSLILDPPFTLSPLIVEKVRQVLPKILAALQTPEFSIGPIEAQLTAHNDGEYFKLHNDNGIEAVASRILTFVYYFHQQPKAFTGGELRIYDGKFEGEKGGKGGKFVPTGHHVVIPRNNCIVFFPSQLMHEVTQVQCPSQKFLDGRFTVNGWIHDASKIKELTDENL